MNMHRELILIAALVAPLLFGCPLEDFPNEIPAVQNQVDRIVDDTTLTPQEQRDALAALGLSATAINGLLDDVELGNQFGGTPRSAHDKVVAGTFTTLTPDEVQLYGDLVSGVVSGVSYQLTDQEAAAVVSLLNQEALNDATALAAFLDDPNSDIPPSIPDGFLEDVLVTADPQDAAVALP